MKNKTKIEITPMLSLHPTVLIGAEVEGKPDFAAVAWITVAAGTPPSIAIALNEARHSLKGIEAHKAFTVNIPGTSLVKETDYCGLISGARTDKVKDCQFRVFYGEVRAPFIEQCPVNIGCSVEQMIKMGSHYLVAGPIKEIMVSDDCMTDGRPDPEKIDPFIFVGYPKGSYYRIGELLAPAFKIGREIKDTRG
jgi:flavin reductase (DIM6/NTAB) family NADH-FMN oxidoreductase RutF